MPEIVCEARKPHHLSRCHAGVKASPAMLTDEPITSSFSTTPLIGMVRARRGDVCCRSLSALLQRKRTFATPDSASSPKRSLYRNSLVFARVKLSASLLLSLSPLHSYFCPMWSPTGRSPTLVYVCVLTTTRPPLGRCWEELVSRLSSWFFHFRRF